MLTADAWARLSELFHQATELPETERENQAQVGKGCDLEHQWSLPAQAEVAARDKEQPGHEQPEQVQVAKRRAAGAFDLGSRGR